MKKLLVFLLILNPLLGKSQDTVRLTHTNYTTVYSKSLHYPVLVQWIETKAKVQCENKLPRKDEFAPDPLLVSETSLAKDYVGSGTDRGHMCPAADNQCLGAKVQTECFYFSNMTPQYHSLNAGDWKKLEERTRNLAIEYDSVLVWCGSIGVSKKIGTTSVPTKCWKVIYIKKLNAYEAYLFDNNTSKPNGLDNNKVDLKIIQSLTNFKFN